MLPEALSYTGVPSCLAPGPRVTEAGDTGSVPENPRDGWAVALGWMAHGRRPLRGMRETHSPRRGSLSRIKFPNARASRIQRTEEAGQP